MVYIYSEKYKNDMKYCNSWKKIFAIENSSIDKRIKLQNVEITLIA